MGRIKRPHGIKSIEEEPENYDATYPDKVALACMINTEVGAVLAVMRRYVRWGGRYIAGDDQFEHCLIQSLKALRKQIFSWTHQWHMISPVRYLQPFLDVIRSVETGAPIMDVALSSVHKILCSNSIDLNTVSVGDAMHLVVDAVTSCRFEVTDPVSEEVVLVRILLVLLACMRSKASVVLSNQHVCTMINTCFRVVHQSGAKGELLQRIARHTLHELIRCIFSHLPDVDSIDRAFINTPSTVKPETGRHQIDSIFGAKQLVNGNGGSTDLDDESAIVGAIRRDAAIYDLHLMTEPYGISCMVQIFHFLCSLLNAVEHTGTDQTPDSIVAAFDEDVPLFVLGLLNSAVELGGPSIRQHPTLLCLIQDDLFHNLMQYGLSSSPLIVSMVCSIVLNLYHHIRTELKLQLEAFFSCVILRLAQPKYGASYQQQEVAMEALVDFCRQDSFMVEMYANLDCDITCSNVFEDLAKLLSKSAFPVNCPLSSMHILALDGLIAVIEGMAERIGSGPFDFEPPPVKLEEYTPFWMVKCENYRDANHWVPFVRRTKFIKRRLIIGADHFNREPIKGLEFLQKTHLLPDKLDPRCVACFFRYTHGLEKVLVGDFMGNHDEFCVQVLHEFAGTFDFQDMSLDTALRLFLETFRLPGESQKIERVLIAFAEKYYEQSPQMLVNKDAALVLSYSLIMLNTDQHNVQVKKKMTEEDFIRNNRLINGGSDLPREFLSELYHSICKNEIRMSREQGTSFPDMSPSRWIDLMHKSKKTAPYILSDSRAYLDRDMFAIMSGPTIAAISVIFDHTEHEDVYQSCIDGFLAVAKISACHRLEDVLDDSVLSLCKFTTLLNPQPLEEPVQVFGEDTKARMATVAVFTIANRYGDYIRSGWRNILDCILRLHKLGLLPACVATDVGAAGEEFESELSSETGSHGMPLTNNISSVIQLPSIYAPRQSSGLMGRFSQLLSLESDEPRSQPTEQQLAAHQRTLQTIQKCRIDSIFTESKFLQPDSLSHLARALIWASGRSRKGGSSGGSSPEDEDTAVFCLELLIAISLNNRDRIELLWQSVYEHIASIVQSAAIPCALVEKAVFGLLRICQRLLPFKENDNNNLADELLRSLQLILKLNCRVADVYFEQITQEVSRLVKTNASQISSQTGWHTITHLLRTSAQYPEASEAGFDALFFVMFDGSHLLPSNYVLCVDAARQFAESRVGQSERSIRALNLMAGSVTCLTRWRREKIVTEDEFGNMWLNLVQGLRKVCSDNREDVRNHAVGSLQRCCCLEPWLVVSHQSIDPVIFSVLDGLLDILAQGGSSKEYRNLEGTVVRSLKLLCEVFVQSVGDLAQASSFCKLWLGVLSRMEKCMRVKVRSKRSEKLQDVVPEVLKSCLMVMKARGILVRRSGGLGGDSLWEITWLHVSNIVPALQLELFPDLDVEHKQVDAASEEAQGR